MTEPRAIKKQAKRKEVDAAAEVGVHSSRRNTAQTNADPLKGLLCPPHRYPQPSCWLEIALLHLIPAVEVPMSERLSHLCTLLLARSLSQAVFAAELARDGEALAASVAEAANSHSDAVQVRTCPSLAA